MHIAETKIIGLHATFESADVELTFERVIVSREAARGLAVGDKVSFGLSPLRPDGLWGIQAGAAVTALGDHAPAAVPAAPETTDGASYPDPTAEDLNDPTFNAIWTAIKGWDLSREPANHRMYSGATGNDVMRILRAVRGSPPAEKSNLGAMIERVQKYCDTHGVTPPPELIQHPDVTQWAPVEHQWSRPEATPFQPATDHEIGIACNKGLTYQYAYPKGAQPADACRWSHIDETEVREELWDIKPGDIVYDIGSAFGSYALSALAAGAAHVVCFNPNPQEQDLLLASARLNGWAGKVERFNVGLWSESGYLNDEEQTFVKYAADREFKVTKTADGRHTQLFEVQTLDSLCLRGLSGRVVVKCDVEGAEAHVLKGARVFFSQVQPAFVLIEKHIFKDATLDARTDEAMAELGYVLVTNRPYHTVVHALYRMKGWDD